MGKVTQVKNGKYIGADKYTITDTSDGKKQIVFSPDSVLEQGTPVGAEILNEIQKNGLYYLVGTHRVDGQESIYDCALVGIDTFEFEQLNVLFKPNVTPTQATVKLNISGQIFTLAEKLINTNQIGLLLAKSEMKAYTWGTKITIVNDLTTGGADKALSGEMGKKLNTDKQNKIDNGLGTDSKEIVGAINEINRYGFDGAGNGTLRIENPNPNNIKNTGLLYLANIADSEYEKLYPVGSKDFYAIHLNYNANAGALQIMQAASGNKVDLYTRVADARPREEQNEPIYTKWESILTSNNKLFLGNAGISKVTYIQDAGTKTINQGYIDKDTGKLYRAKENNTDITVTSKFELADNISNSKKNTYETVFSGNVSVGTTISLDINKYRYFLAYGRVPSASTFIPKEYNGLVQVTNIGTNGSDLKTFNINKSDSVLRVESIQGSSSIAETKITICGVI